MAIYVDKPKLKEGFFRGGWCHLMIDKDVNLQKLHDFAESIGLRLEWFQDNVRKPHYDLSPPKRKLAIKNGATTVEDKELINKCFR